MKEYNKSAVRIKKRIFHLICFFILIALDQITKQWARNVLSGENGLKAKDISVIPKVLVFSFVKNTGAVFGMFKNQILPITISAIFLIAVICWFYLRIPENKRYYPLLVIIVFIGAGACGNVIDRITLGYVTDFIYFEFINFFVFNVADMYITVSICIMIILTIFYYKEEELEYIFFKKKQLTADRKDDSLDADAANTDIDA